jgi:hypothetical protein
MCVNELYPLMRSITYGKKSWANYREYSPSFKAAKDSKLDWSQ